MRQIWSQYPPARRSIVMPTRPWAAERLVLPRCPRDGFFFYPRTRCPSCLKDDWTWEQASGRGEVHAFTIDRFGHDPAFAERAPFTIAVVELEEGPRMTAGIRDCEPSEGRWGLQVEATYEHVDPGDERLHALLDDVVAMGGE